MDNRWASRSRSGGRGGGSRHVHDELGDIEDADVEVLVGLVEQLADVSP
jgi:hypothetical protein